MRRNFMLVIEHLRVNMYAPGFISDALEKIGVHMYVPSASRNVFHNIFRTG